MATQGVQLLRATARAAFWQNFEAVPNFIDRLAMRVDSNADQETYPWLAYAPGVREMEGSRTHVPVPELSLTIKNKKWENSVPIAYETWRFGKLNAVSSLVSNLGVKARWYANDLISQLINTGHSTACYDTQFFYDTDHSDPGAAYTTSQDNDLTAAIVSATAPTDLEFATALRAIRNQFYTFKDGYGDPIIPTLDEVFELHVPAGYLSVAERVFYADSLTGPLANDMRGRFRPVMNPWIDATGTTAHMFAFRVNGVRKPFIYQVADPVMMEDDFGLQHEFESKERRVGSFGYYNVGYGDWRYSIRYLFTTA